MVYFNDQATTIQFIPGRRNSLYDSLFWNPEDLAEFRQDAFLEKAGIPRELIERWEQEQKEMEEKEKQEESTHYNNNNNTRRYGRRIQGYNRPDNWLPLELRPGKIGYAIRIKNIILVPADRSICEY